MGRLTLNMLLSFAQFAAPSNGRFDGLPQTKRVAWRDPMNIGVIGFESRSRERHPANMTTNNDRQVWFITGSARGLGRALVQGVLEAGHRVVATARQPAYLDWLIKQHGERVKSVTLEL